MGILCVLMVTVMLVCVTARPAAATWLEDLTSSAMDTAGVKAYTDKLHGALNDVHSAITNVVDKVDWKKVYLIGAEKIKPTLKKGLPVGQCARTVKIRSPSSELLLENGNISEINNIKTVSVRIINETETDINVLFKVEYSELKLEYMFTCSNNILQDLYDSGKRGRLLIVQKEPLYVAIAASVPKLNSVLTRSMKKGECVIKLQTIEGVNEGTLTFDKMKYQHSEFQLTKHTVSRIMNRARQDIKGYIAEGMKFAVETEIRNNNLFCIPESTQGPLDCKAVTFKALYL